MNELIIVMKKIISASRRTDLPRWHLQETMENFKKEEVTLFNETSKQNYTITLKKDEIYCIVWWSRDYSIFLKQPYLDFFKQYNNFFQISLLGYMNPFIQKKLEPGVTSSLDERIEQVYKLVEEFSPKQIQWRFDPIVFWKSDEDGKIKHNLGDLKTISGCLGDMGVKRCVISFTTWYAKSRKRAEIRNFPYHDPSEELKKKIAIKIAKINYNNKIRTYACADDPIVDDKLILKSHCIDGYVLEKLFKGKITKARDTAQRGQCGCTKSFDIGSYNQKCKHMCLPCYANPDLIA